VDAQPSAYAVAARETADIVAAVNFARDNNLRLVVKGGGHSYLGTSNAPDSLLIWTRAMNDITLHMHPDRAGPDCHGRLWCLLSCATLSDEGITNPAVVGAFALAIIASEGPPAIPGLVGHEPDLVDARKNAREIVEAMDELKKVAPDAGSYVAESSFFERAGRNPIGVRTMPGCAP
jgi:hypothetical protein